jgi:hypothetical protein
LSSSAPAISFGSKPPAMAIPLSGMTTNSATALGRSAPQMAAHIQRRLPWCFCTSAHRIGPQTPPQNASDNTAGTPKGGTAAMFQAARGNTPPKCSSCSTPWWKTSVDTNPATNDSTHFFMIAPH